MHYTPGTDIVVSHTAAPSRNGPQPLNVPGVQRTNRNEYFEPGISYTLYNIRPQPDSTYEYTFATPDGKILSYVFESVAAAERVIAQARGEDLPDYEGYHRHHG